MDNCEYKARCVNSDKCYRCFEQSLLKLPKDKTMNKYHNKKHVYNKAVADSDNSWEDLENQVSDMLNNVPSIKEARRSLASGALPFDKGDVKDGILHCECKERKGTLLKSGEKSLSIKKEWLTKAKHEADENNTYMCNPFRFKGDDVIYANIIFKDLAELVNITKAYQIDSVALAKEVKALHDVINKNKENNYLTSDYYLDLDKVFNTISVLYNTYGKANDLTLTEDAKELKIKINDFISKIKSL